MTSPDAATLPLIDQLRAMPPDERRDLILGLSPDLAMALAYDWYGVHARPNQCIPAGEWRTWFLLAGRGFGKTRTAVEWVKFRVAYQGARRIHLVARTKADIRDVLVDGPSGFLSEDVYPPGEGPEYQPSKRRLVWPNGAVAITFSAEEPDQLRGPQGDTGLADEVAAWPRPETWDNLVFGLRVATSLGYRPQIVAATTPKRVDLVRKILRRSGVALSTGSTFENRDNLDPSFFDELKETYEGTRLGQQELLGMLLEDNEDALWKFESMIEAHRVGVSGKRGAPLQFRRIVVAVDPEAASMEGSAETGIIVGARGYDNHYYVLEDATLRGSPAEWGATVARMARKWAANLVVGEVNNGGDMVGFVIQQADPRLAYKAVHASRGKLTRAEPVSALYERGFAHHVGYFPDLESQMCEWQPGDKSPDRLDANVWCATELMLGAGLPPTVPSVGRQYSLPADYIDE